MKLEGYGLLRMLAKRIHAPGLINFEEENLDLHSAIDQLRGLKPESFSKIEGLDGFDRYVPDYFFNGVALQESQSQNEYFGQFATQTLIFST